jgi:hypothetical protein
MLCWNTAARPSRLEYALMTLTLALETYHPGACEQLVHMLLQLVQCVQEYFEGMPQQLAKSLSNCLELIC